jgi:hypothetical protein
MTDQHLAEMTLWQMECEVARLDAMKRSLTPHDAIELRQVAEHLNKLSDEVLNAD